MTALVATPNGVWLREAIAELKRTSRLPQFLVPTVLTPAAFYGLFTLAVAKSPSPEYALATLVRNTVFGKRLENEPPPLQ